MNVAWLLAVVAAYLNGQPVCEPPAAIAATLREADQPHDLRRSLDEHRAAIHAVFEKGLRAHPEDPFLQAARLEFDLGRSGENRPALAAEAEKPLAQAPEHPHRLYVAALANYSLRTPRALELIGKLHGIHAGYGPALLLEARIRSSRSFRSADRVKAAVAEYGKVCPEGLARS